jgi:RluA family pseudouridine synthase
VIEIVWDGDLTVAVNKPAGLPTQAPGDADSLERRLRDQLAARSGYLAFPHRLDRHVSGLVLVALGKRAARLLSDQFACRKIEKVYLAELSGRLDPSQDIWVDWLRKIPDRPQAAIGEPSDPLARRAETHTRVIRFDAARQTSLVKLMPVTGRMHQLRLQAASRQHPIVGDTLYGSQPDGESCPPHDSIPRIMLHAHSLAFHDPRNGKRVQVEAKNDAGLEP